MNITDMMRSLDLLQNAPEAERMSRIEAIENSLWMMQRSLDFLARKCFLLQRRVILLEETRLNALKSKAPTSNQYTEHSQLSQLTNMDLTPPSQGCKQRSACPQTHAVPPTPPPPPTVSSTQRTAVVSTTRRPSAPAQPSSRAKELKSFFGSLKKNKTQKGNQDGGPKGQ